MSDSDDMNPLENQVGDFLATVKRLPPSGEALNGLGELLYTMNELGMWPDCVDSVGVDQAIQCWKVVEAVIRRGGVPENLKM